MYSVPGALTCNAIVPRLWTANWVGVDGFGSKDVLQAGTDSDAACDQGFPGDHALYYAWIEWYPAPSIIRNLPIVPGDLMLIGVAITPYANKWVLTVSDVTRRKSVSTVMSPPPGTQLIGDSIEWVIERPSVNGTLANLAPYARNAWMEMQGYYQQGALIYKPSSPPSGITYAITMQDNSGQAISIPTLYPGSAVDTAWFDNPAIY